MSFLSELPSFPGSRKAGKRLGRGKGSGRGGTSGKGHKGQKARKSGTIPAGFEGGGMPLHRRLPKFGFSNSRFKAAGSIVNLSQLKDWEGDVTPEALIAKGLARRGEKIKILAKTESSNLKPLNVTAHKFSAKARELIEKSGGQAIELPEKLNKTSKAAAKKRALKKKAGMAQPSPEAVADKPSADSASSEAVADKPSADSASPEAAADKPSADSAPPEAAADKPEAAKPQDAPKSQDDKTKGGG